MRPLPVIQRSLVYAADGTEIGEFREAATRMPVPPERIPDTVKRAGVAAEDHTFYDHSGIDGKGRPGQPGRTTSRASTTRAAPPSRSSW